MLYQFGPVQDTSDTLQCRMYTHPINQDDSCDLVLTCTATIVDKRKSQAYSYTFYITDELHRTLVDFYNSGVYAWDSNAVVHAVPGRPNLRLPFRHVKSVEGS